MTPAAALLAAWLACLSGCAPERELVYDLAELAPFADRSSRLEVVLLATAAGEGSQAMGFYPAGPYDSVEGGFVWARKRAELRFHWPRPRARVVIVELTPSPGLRDQRASVLLNGQPIEQLDLSVGRRHRVPLPAQAQREGENRLRFDFSAASVPAEHDPRNRDERELAAAFGLLVVAGADDASLEDLLRPGAPSPFAVRTEGGSSCLDLVGPSTVHYALTTPRDGELRFTPRLHQVARSAAARARLRVTLEEEGGAERAVWDSTISGAADSEVSIPLPAAPGSLLRLGFEVAGAGSNRFSWVILEAPRILGRGQVAGLRPGARSDDDLAQAEPLRLELQGSHVLLILLDAARARNIGAYGYARSTTPEIDRIAREGVVFRRAFTPAVYTLAAMSSLWTSRLYLGSYQRPAFAAPLPVEAVTLAELVSERGVLTAGFVANPMATRAYGLGQGFAEFHELFRELGTDADAFRQVLPAWFRARARDGERFFAYVHFREPHFPYAPRPPFDALFGAGGPLDDQSRRDPRFLREVNQGARSLSPPELSHLERLYDGNLAQVDHEVGEIRRVLEAEGLWERTLVIVASDHGEALGEHGYFGHNTQLYDESVRIPLIIRFPGSKGPAGTHVDALVDLMDVAPTIAEVLGVGRQAQEPFTGRSLLDVVRGASGKRAVLSRGVSKQPSYALRDGEFTYIRHARRGAEELYDVTADPGERRNLAEHRPVRAAYYRQELRQWLARARRDEQWVTAAPARLNRAQCESLKALGYLASDAGCPAG